MKVAIIGMGVVGKAQARMFGDVVTYDAADDAPYPEQAIAGCDFAVITVGTPPAADGSADVSQVHAAIGRLPAAMPVLIRSTIPPGTTDSLRGSVCHAPEFLQEREGGIWAEASEVPYLILGGPPDTRAFLVPLLAQVFPGLIHQCTALQAELVKYTANLYWAGRVTFVNEMAAICAAFGASWEDVREAWLLDGRVQPAYTAMAGFEPGFAGRCWPKDLSALRAASSAAGYRPLFLDAIEQANARFRNPVVWDMLICTIPHRHAKLVTLLAELDRQMQPGVAVRVFHDNLETSYGSKCDALVRSSQADYVSFVDDDDMVAPDFVARIMQALDGHPDYVGFPVRYTSDGVPQMRVEHSLRHDGWSDSQEILCRDIAQFNPIRRELALLGRWEGGMGAERDWANGVRDSGLCVQEAWIEEPMYYYQHSPADTFVSGRAPFLEGDIQPVPQYPWLTLLERP